MILDVGSGTQSLFHVKFEGENILHVDVARAAFHVEVVCDAMALPFKDSCFNMVYASHVLEHVTNPYKMVAELKRVSENTVVIKVPNESFSRFRNSGPREHLYGWNRFTLRNFLERQFASVEVTGNTRLTDIPFLKKMGYVFLTKWFEPNELTAVCRDANQ